MDTDEIVCTAVIERESSSTPRFVAIPSCKVEKWDIASTTLVEGVLNEANLGLTSLQIANDERWIIELSAPWCAKAQVTIGDSVTLRLRLASDEMPAELQAHVDADPEARGRWNDMTDGDRRRLRDHVTSARLTETRAQRSREGLS